jgi:hypothetical protein
VVGRTSQHGVVRWERHGVVRETRRNADRADDRSLLGA